jgi:hypothetical protein
MGRHREVRRQDTRGRVAVVRDFLREMLTGLARWPLLLGAAVCFGFAVYEEIFTDANEVALAIAGTVIGSVLLGGWLVSYVIDGERRWHRDHHDPPTRR